MVVKIVIEKQNASPRKYHKDLSIIAAASLFEEHCAKGWNWVSYVPMGTCNKDKREFFFDQFKSTILENFDDWATTISKPYQDVKDDELKPYISGGKHPNIFSPVHIVWQSIRIAHV